KRRILHPTRVNADLLYNVSYLMDLVQVTRRSVITLLGGALATWPLAAPAQQGERVRRIGVLNYLPADDPNSSPRVAAFAQALQGLGWIGGRNIQIDYRWGGGDLDRSRRYATELVALR